MSFLLFKLSFTAPVHFGAQDSALSLYSSEEFFRADTLFSALCHTALHTEGEAGLERLCEAVKAGKLLFSDSMPYCDDELYLPKPYVSSESVQELNPELRKAVKKLRWIPVRSFEAFSTSVRGGKPYEPEKVSFGVHEEHTKAAIIDGEDAKPYQVGAFRFSEKCGLWFICLCDGEYEDWLEKLVNMLGFSGIGGEVSSGYGSFIVDDLIHFDEPCDEQTDWLYHSLNAECGRYLLITTCLPSGNELDDVLHDASYQLTRRGGFIQSESYSEQPRKKETQYFLSAGSVISRKFSGELFDVSAGGNHPVYRYSRPVLLGVSL